MKQKLITFITIIITITLFSCKQEISIDETPPSDITSFTATAMDSKILLSWTNPEDEDFAGIEVSCEPKTGSLENPVTLKKDVTSLFVYELENGTEYTFTVKSFDSSGNFSAGVTSTGTPIDSSDKTPPKEATDFSATAMDSKILLSWTEPEDEDFGGVEISCEPKVGSLENPVTLKKDVTSLFVYELENGTEYTFTIKSFDTSGNFSAGTTCTGTPIDSSDKTPPADVTDFSATAMDSKILLSWTEPEDEDFGGVEISCEPKAGSLENPATLKKGVSSLIVYGLENGTEYTFTIKTFDTSGNFSTGVTSTGTPVDSSDKTPPSTPSDFTAEAMDSAVKLSWIDATDEDFFGYELTWTPKSSASVSRAVTGMKADSIFVSPTENERNEITISNLLNGTEYTFTLKSMDTSGNKSEGVIAKGTPTATPDVSRLTAIYYDGKTHISWTNPSGISGVEIFADGKKVECDIKTVASSVYGNYSYCILENSQPGKVYLLKTKNKAGQFSSGMAASAVETELPVVNIETENGVDVSSKSNKIPAKINILNSSGMENPNPDAAITIKGRGNSSWSMAKKSYTIKFENKSKVLGMPEHATWALIANYSDKTLLHNSIAYEMGRQIFTNMSWNPSTKNVQLFLNGEYIGLYMLTESVKINKNRVNIPNLEDYEKKGGEINDYGFLLEINARLDESFNFTTEKGVCISLKEPDGKDISNELKVFIQETVQTAEDALYSDNFTDSTSENFYENYFDVDSFIDWWLVNEIAKNRDAIFFSSCYLYFNAGKLHMGPLWDFDIGFGNDGETSCGKTDSFYIKNAKWISRMFDDEKFIAKAKARWTEKHTELLEFFDSNVKNQFGTLTSDANVNFTRWPILGTYVWPNAAGYETRTTYKSECDFFNDWISARIEWLNTAINEL